MRTILHVGARTFAAGTAFHTRPAARSALASSDGQGSGTARGHSRSTVNKAAHATTLHPDQLDHTVPLAVATYRAYYRGSTSGRNLRPGTARMSLRTRR